MVQPLCSDSVCCASFHVLDASRIMIMNLEMQLKRARPSWNTSSNKKIDS